MNESIMKAAGFENQVDEVKAGRCPFCSKEIYILHEFKDELSLREYSISGLCQSCQDEMFN